MPTVPMLKVTSNGKQRIVGWLSFFGKYKPGDPRPSGYNDFFEWAEVQHKAGLRQVLCSRCSKWKFPQELHRTDMYKSVAYRTKRDAMAERNPQTIVSRCPVCIDCATPHTATQEG